MTPDPSCHGESPPQSLLVYTYEDTVGDGLVKLPFLQDLRARLPATRITWCAGVGPTSYAGALAPLTTGLLDEVMGEAGIGTGAAELLRLSRPLGGRRFDVVLDTQHTLVRTLCVRRVAHGCFVSGAAGFRFSDRRPPAGAPRPRHLIDDLAGLLDLLTPRPAAVAAPPLAVPDAYRAAACAALPDGTVYVGLAPGAGDSEKIWPLAGFIALAREQLEQGRVPVFFLGPDERGLLEDIRAAVPGARFPEWEGRGATGPIFAIALAERLAAAVANDSGAGHMLAAGGAPLVSLFSKHDPEKYAPRARRLAVVDSKSFGGTDPARIPVDAVSRALAELLA
ncbi:MAG: lipopolysaccharide heptosyltransferase family protein [Alphaproteobacteria bacterium]|nr:lipopolysaccharide heptosyltransferase family protein [Alphaproteobacteria bacterium]